MNIFDTIIKETEIIGIGMFNAYPSDNVFTKVTYSFRVFTKSNSILFTSPEVILNSEEASKWLNRFAHIRHIIGEQIGDISPNDFKVPHIDRVGDAYETLKDQLNDLLSDLVPVESCQKPVNPRISEIYESIRSLRDLACIPVL